MEAPNVIAMIREAAASPAMRRVARKKLAELLTEGDLLDYQGRKPEIRPSDYGTCRLSLWADFHGLADLPRDPIDDQLARLDLGSLVGAWEGCLLWAYCLADDYWVCELEYVPEGGGHIDALLVNGGDGIRIPVEFKSGYDTGVIKSPEQHHLLQVGDYAKRVGAEEMILVYIRPPAKSGNRMRQFVVQATPYAPLVDRERERLAPALGDDPPTPDPQAGWACYTCRYPACEANKNKMQDSAEALF